jgi:hypothetical protein
LQLLFVGKIWTRFHGELILNGVELIKFCVVNEGKKT